MEKYHEATRGDLASTVAAAKDDATKTIESLRSEHAYVPRTCWPSYYVEARIKH